MSHLDPQLHKLISELKEYTEKSHRGVLEAAPVRKKAWRTGKLALWLQVLDLVLVSTVLYHLWFKS